MPHRLAVFAALHFACWLYAGPGVATAAINVGMVGHYKLNETAGTLAADSSGAGATGILVNMNPAADWVPGIRKGALRFNDSGTDDHVTLPGSVLNGRADVTVAFWLQTDYNGRQTVLSAAHSGESDELLIDLQNHQRLDVYFHGSRVRWDIDSIRYAGWKHFAVLRDDANNLATLYIDGVSQGTQAASLATLNVDPNGLVIGQNLKSVGGGFKNNQDLRSTLDDLRIYNRLLTEAEIQDLLADPDLIGHWRLDETAGTLAVDSSASGYDGQRSGGSWTSDGVYNGSLLLDGGTAVNMGDVIRFDPSDPFTIAAWVKTSQPSGMTVVGKADTAADNRGYSVELLNNGGSRVVYAHLTSGGADGVSKTGTIQIGDDRWHHVAVSYDGGGSVAGLKIFVDGVEDTAAEAENTTITGTSQSAAPLQIGAGGLNFAFNGGIDDVRIYEVALEGPAISRLAGILGHWKFDETSGLVARDASAAGYDGTLVNMDATAAWTTGQVDGAIEFAEMDDRVLLPHEALDGAEDVTAAFWLKTTNTQSQAVVSGANASDANEYLIYFNNDRRIRLYINKQNVSWSFASIADDAWHHFAIVADATSGQATFYLDGVSQGSKSTTIGYLQIDPGGLVLGESQGSVGGGFNANKALLGSLDDLRLFNRVLTDAEISEFATATGGDNSAGIRIIRWIEIQ